MFGQFILAGVMIIHPSGASQEVDKKVHVEIDNLQHGSAGVDHFREGLMQGIVLLASEAQPTKKERKRWFFGAEAKSYHQSLYGMFTEKKERADYVLRLSPGTSFGVSRNIFGWSQNDMIRWTLIHDDSVIGTGEIYQSNSIFVRTVLKDPAKALLMHFEGLK